MVLLVEPDPDLVPLWQFFFARLGCRVRLATTRAEATQLAQAQPPALALVRPDPASAGWALCRKLQTAIGVPVIGLLPQEARGEPATDLHVLPLPVDLRALREVVQLLMTMSRA
jgi:DNA-binding response OmpR family regulator